MCITVLISTVFWSYGKGLKLWVELDLALFPPSYWYNNKSASYQTCVVVWIWNWHAVCSSSFADSSSAYWSIYFLFLRATRISKIRAVCGVGVVEHYFGGFNTMFQSDENLRSKYPSEEDGRLRFLALSSVSAMWFGEVNLRNFYFDLIAHFFYHLF